MERIKFIEGHWYAGATGKPRKLLRIENTYTYIYRWPKSDKEHRCWYTTFEKWAVSDIGTGPRL